jgi:hypothetical protein
MSAFPLEADTSPGPGNVGLVQILLQKSFRPRRRNIDSSSAFTWQGRFKTQCAAEQTLRREPIQLTFATLSAMNGRFCKTGGPQESATYDAVALAYGFRRLHDEYNLKRDELRGD